MADPVTLGSISLGASAGGSLLSAFGASSKGKAESQMYSYQARVAELNKQIAEQNRDYALASGEKEAQRYGMKAAQERGAIRAQQGASGIAINSGSAVDVQESQAQIAKMDLATIRSNAARVAYGYSVEAASQSNQSTLYKMASTNAKKAGSINALSSLISGASSVSSKWMQLNQAGVFGKSTEGDYYTSGPLYAS